MYRTLMINKGKKPVL